jgi:hypothetical protein
MRSPRRPVAPVPDTGTVLVEVVTVVDVVVGAVVTGIVEVLLGEVVRFLRNTITTARG